MPLQVLALNCSPKSSTVPSSTQKLLTELMSAFSERGAHGEILRVVDFNIKPGVSADEGPRDDRPSPMQRIWQDS
jgi:multimeric flavodoxin WrbA